MTKAKKLIEVAMPIKEISAESVRDKSIRHGHISTLHLWWARRPLPVCRAVVFASLVPDPLDENCPQTFRDAVENLLGSAKYPLHEQGMLVDAYKPYDDIPYTAAIDKMEDNLRNRLMMFIGKFTDKYAKLGEKTPAKDLLSDYSLIKWDNKNNEAILNKARKLIWVAHSINTNNKLSAKEMLSDFEKHYKAIKDAEQELYSIIDRHIETENIKLKSQNLRNAIEAFLDKMPKVFDPFAGGGAIPLEATRLGCRSFGNDINPVAHIIQKGSLEFPQKYGKPITYSKAEFIKLYGKEEFNKASNETKVFENGKGVAVNIENRLSFDVEFYAKKLLAEAEKEIGYLYPADEKGNKPIAYYWARVGTCSNPSCKAEIPLLKGFYLANTKTKHIHLKSIINGNQITFEIKEGPSEEEGWMTSSSLKCPCCGNTTEINEIKQQSKNGTLKQKLLAIIEDSPEGKRYHIPTQKELSSGKFNENLINPLLVPNEEMLEIPDLVSGRGWGIKKWSQMFTARQLLFLQTIITKLKDLRLKSDTNDYSKAVFTYLGILVDRAAMNMTAFGMWELSRENLKTPFARQAIPMIFDFPEGNPFCNSTGSPSTQIKYMIKFILSESVQPFITYLINASSGEKSQFNKKHLTAVITDPPYYDAIAYADLSDFFYVWLKRTLGDIYPLNFATPQTPKTEECTALKHHRSNSKQLAKDHFENKLLQIFDAIEHQTSDIVSIMFAHQSTEAWTTLCNSILGARMNITGSWAIDSELTTAAKTGRAVLASSVTVACKPFIKQGFGDYKEVKKSIERTVEKEVEELYQLGFRGADLLTACFGQAVSEFGKYEKVEKADGSEVTVADLLEMARESAFNALLKGFDGDDFTKFYIGWLQLYSFTESDFDDAAKFSRVGLSINVSELFTEHILIKNGNKQTLGTFEQRILANNNLGERATNYLIDIVHCAMALYKGNNRNALLQYIATVAAQPENSFWRVITSLCEVLPAGSEDHKQALGLLTSKDSLIRECKIMLTKQPVQKKLYE